MTESDQPTEEYDVKAGFDAEDKEEAAKPKRKAKPKAVDVPKLHVNWFSISHNARHPDVKVWQRQMEVRGYELDVDGVFGSECEQLARQLQADAHLVESGAVGTRTWQATWTEQ